MRSWIYEEFYSRYLYFSTLEFSSYDENFLIRMTLTSMIIKLA